MNSDTQNVQAHRATASSPRRTSARDLTPTEWSDAFGERPFQPVCSWMGSRVLNMPLEDMAGRPMWHMPPRR